MVYYLTELMISLLAFHLQNVTALQVLQLWSFLTGSRKTLLYSHLLFQQDLCEMILNTSFLLHF